MIVNAKQQDPNIKYERIALGTVTAAGAVGYGLKEIVKNKGCDHFIRQNYKNIAKSAGKGALAVFGCGLTLLVVADEIKDIANKIKEKQ